MVAPLYKLSKTRMWACSPALYRSYLVSSAVAHHLDTPEDDRLGAGGSTGADAIETLISQIN
jgi:hypothetical protein